MEPETATASDEPQQPFQFSLASLLTLITVAAVFLSALFRGTDWAATVACLILFTVWPMALVIILIYGRGKKRTFSIGALFPSAPIFLQSSSLYAAPVYGRIGGSIFALADRLRLTLSCLLMLLASILCGLAALGIRRLVERAERQEKPIAAADDAREESAGST
jgi:hypothetical protein